MLLLPKPLQNTMRGRAEEVESRFDAFDCGELKESPVEDVFARLNQR